MRRSAAINRRDERARPGRPRRFDRDAVLDRALEIFWQKGYAGTTIRELENELFLNQSSIYNSFGSKAQFFDSVLDRYETRASMHLLAPLEVSNAGLQALKRYFSDFTEWISGGQRRGCLLINVMSELSAENPRLVQRSRQFQQRLQACFEGALDRAGNEREIGAGDNAARAMILVGLTLGLNTAARIQASKAELQRLTGAIQGQIDGWSITADP